MIFKDDQISSWWFYTPSPFPWWLIVNSALLLGTISNSTGMILRVCVAEIYCYLTIILQLSNKKHICWKPMVTYPIVYLLRPSHVHFILILKSTIFKPNSLDRSMYSKSIMSHRDIPMLSMQHPPFSGIQLDIVG